MLDKLNDIEKYLLEKFKKIVERHVKNNPQMLNNFDLIEFLSENNHLFDIKFKKLKNISPLKNCILLTLLDIYKTYNNSSLKYTSIESFLLIYMKYFRYESNEELNILWQTANYMNILIKFLSPKYNKGLFLYVVTTFIEGAEKKYVTGSGQTRKCNNRVIIYNVESNIFPEKRLKINKKEKRKNINKNKYSTMKNKKIKRENISESDYIFQYKDLQNFCTVDTSIDCVNYQLLFDNVHDNIYDENYDNEMINLLRNTSLLNWLP